MAFAMIWAGFLSLSLTVFHPSFGSFAAEHSTQDWARELEKSIVQLMEKESELRDLEKSYQELSKSNVQQIPINGSKLVELMAHDVTEAFSKKLDALNNILDAADKIVLEFKYNHTLQNVSFLDMEQIMENDSSLVDYPLFKQKVDMNQSGVHIPLEIFSGYPQVQNGLKWSQRLDEVFKANLANNSKLSWQYFGSQVGFIRVYPANRWKTISDMPNLYDVRRRPWYIHGSTSPKDILILVDTSGSVLGQTFEIMKIAIKTLINTLEENDYVNVAWFKGTTVQLATCFDTFVQANSRNKRILFNGIDSFVVSNTSSYAQAMEFAFQQFQQFNSTKDSHEGAECHQVIMLFTDGGTESADEVIKTYNKDKKIRIFTYAVGPHSVPIHTIKSMACKNKGYFNPITTMAATNTKIQQYPNVLVRPMALNQSRTPSWSTVYTDAGGLGHIISATLPVYNRSLHGKNQSIMGVVGIDTPVSELDAMTPYDKIGPIAYSFAINNNGYVIFHPKMKQEYSYLEDAPDVDFLDLEHDDNGHEYLKQMRTNMIDSETGSHKISAFTETDDKDHIVNIATNYFYTPISNTPFSLGLAIPADRKKYLHIINMSTKNGLPVKDGDLIAFREYCINITSTSDNEMDFTQRLSDEIKWKSGNCNNQMVQRLLWDIRRTENWPKNPNVSDGVVAKYLGTEGGLLRVVPRDQAINYDDIITRDPLKAPYYRNSLIYKTWTFVRSNQSNNTEDPTIDALKAVTGDQGLNFAVVGVQFKESLLFDKLNNTFDGLEHWHCNNPELFQCYLLDDGGFIVSSNQKRNSSTKQHGLFFGSADESLMWQLYNKSVYIRRKKMNFHATCVRDRKTNFSPKSFTIPSITNLLTNLNLYWMLELPSWFYFKQTIQSLFWSSAMPVAESRRHKNHWYACSKTRMQYTYGPIKTADDVILSNCGDCKRKFQVERLMKTNLLLVISEVPMCETCESFDKLNFKPEEVPELCNDKPRYRRRPTLCFAHHPDEDTSICSGGERRKMAAVLGTVIFLSILHCLSKKSLNI